MNHFESVAEREIFFLGRQLLRLEAELPGISQGQRLELYQEAMIATLSSLRHVPGFAGGKVLEELLFDLSDVIAGKDALAPVSQSGRPKHGWRDIRLQAWATAAVDIFVAKGEREAAACKFVAKMLTEGGHRGRRSGSISASTVRQWRSHASPLGDKELAYLLRVQMRRAFEQHLTPEADLKLAQEQVSRVLRDLSKRERADSH